MNSERNPVVLPRGVFNFIDNENDVWYKLVSIAKSKCEKTKKEVSMASIAKKTKKKVAKKVKAAEKKVAKKVKAVEKKVAKKVKSTKKKVAKRVKKIKKKL